MAGAGAGKPPAMSGDNVKVCVRVRPVAAGTDTAWAIPDSGPEQLQLYDTKGKLTMTYGVGSSLEIEFSAQKWASGCAVTSR
jgi:hypothetical protein